MTHVSSQEEPSLNDVVSLFKDYSGDESGGQHAIRGFSFQVWQAVLEALRAHSTGLDYAIVLEWQQDIAVLDSSEQPRRVTFIQLKKNESSHRWTLNGLLSTPTEPSSKSENSAIEDAAAPSAPRKRTGLGKKRPARSILAKLYVHRQRFSKLTPPPELVFASNAPFFVDIGDEGQEETVSQVKLNELPVQTIAKIEAAFRKQLEVPADEVIDLGSFTLKVTNCPTEEAHKFAVGELVELCLHNKIEPHVTAPFVAICLIASYVHQRAGKHAYAKDFASLLERAITRTDVTRYFAAANDTHVRPQHLVAQVIARLNAELAEFELVQEMEAAVNSACAEVTNRASVVWLSAEALADLYAKNTQYKAHGHLKDRLPAWLSDFRAIAIQHANLFSDGFIYCLMAMIIKNAQPLQHLSASAPDSQPEAAQ